MRLDAVAPVEHCLVPGVALYGPCRHRGSPCFQFFGGLFPEAKGVCKACWGHQGLGKELLGLGNPGKHATLCAALTTTEGGLPAYPPSVQSATLDHEPLLATLLGSHSSGFLAPCMPIRLETVQACEAIEGQ